MRDTPSVIAGDIVGARWLTIRMKSPRRPQVASGSLAPPNDRRFTGSLLDLISGHPGRDVMGLDGLAPHGQGGIEDEHLPGFQLPPAARGAADETAFDQQMDRHVIVAVPFDAGQAPMMSEAVAMPVEQQHALEAVGHHAGRRCRAELRYVGTLGVYRLIIVHRAGLGREHQRLDGHSCSSGHTTYKSYSATNVKNAMSRGATISLPW